jgi:hypothetical protein
MAGKPHIRRLVDDRDVHGLIQALRYPEAPEIRAQAAQALGKLGKVKAVESLIRSFIQDPDPDVRQAALDALHQIIGGEAEMAISAYIPPEDTWIEEKSDSSQPPPAEIEASDTSNEESSFEEDEEEMDEEDEDDQDDDDLDESNEQDSDTEDGVETIWTENDIQALLSVIRVDRSRRKRLKAIQALSQIPNTRAIDALASIALWSEEKWLRQAAREALKGVYGDSVEEVLQSYRDGSLDRLAGEGNDEGDEPADDDEDGDEDDEDDDYDGEDEDEYDEEDDEDNDEDDEKDDGAGKDQLNHYLPLTSPEPAVSPVIREEKPGWGTYLLFGLLLLVIVGGVIYLLNR